VPVFLTPSWLLIAAFITVSYADFMRDQVQNVSDAGSYGLALVFALALAVSILAHELGHTLVSRALGLDVRRIVIFLLGGVSEIEGDPTRPRDEFAIAAAGPLVSFLLAAGCWLGGLPVDAHTSLGVMLALLAWSNLVVAVFNVLPGLPLDGGRLVQSAVWALGRSRSSGAIVAAWCGRAVAVLLAIGVLAGNALLADQDTASLTTLGAAAMGFAVAAFLWIGASQTLRSTAVTAKAAQLSASSLLRPTLYLAAETPVAEALRRVAEVNASGLVVIDSVGRSRALVRENDLRRLEPSQRPWTTIGQFARPLEPGLILEDGLSGEELLSRVRATPASEYLVIGADGASRGILATSDLARALGLPMGGPQA
jgi:Zn-dependent protease/CBS domain-containing protein